MIKFQHSRYAGFSLIESLVYVAIVAIMAALVVSILLSTAKSYNSLKLSRNINNSAMTSLERMIREIRAADDVLLIDSDFGAHPGRLTMQFNAVTAEFYLDGNTLKIKEDDIEAGSLTSANVSVDSLIFYLLDNGTSKAIRIEMTLSGTDGNISKTKNFYSFVVLRNSY